MKRILSIMLAVLLLFSSIAVLADTPTENKITFTDVNANTTRGAAIYKMANAGILLGDGDGTFRPDDPITRGELTKIVNMIFGYTEKDATSFKDVNDTHWYKENVLIAQKAGYIKGYEDGTFRGDNFITREETCTILTRVADVADLGYAPVIADEVSDWAVPYVSKVIGGFFMTLEEGNKFRATENITRAEFCEAFAKFVVEKPVVTPPTEDKTDENKENTKPGTSTGGNTGSGTSKPGTSTGGNTGDTVVIAPPPSWEIGGDIGMDPNEPDNNDPGDDGSGDDGSGGDQPADYTEENDEIIGHLETVLEFLGNMDIGNPTEEEIVGIVYDAIDLVISQATPETLIDSIFVADLCEGDMTYVVELYRGMSDEEQETFKEKFTYGDGDDTIAFNTLLSIFDSLRDMIL